MVGSETDARRHVSFTFDGVRFLVPQDDVAAVESVLDLEPAAEPGACGTVRTGNDRCPAYALTGDLEPLDTPPPARRVCVVLDRDGKRLGLLADHAGNVDGGTLRFEPLPECMREQGSPVTALTIREGAPTFLLSSPMLGAWLLPEPEAAA